MNADDQLNGFKKVRKVDAPPFLYTRIRARIDALAEAPAPVQWVWTFAAAFVLIVAMNAGILISTISPQTGNDVADVVNTMQLAPSNDIYHD